MGHGTSEIDPAPSDPVEDGLFADYKAAEALALYASDNLRDAEFNVQLAKIASDGAHNRAQAAAIRLRQHRDKIRQ